MDLGQLLIGRAHSGDLAVTALPDLHDALVLAYLQGLRDEGCDADPPDVRYGYDAAVVIRSGFTSLSLDQMMQPPAPGLSAEVAQRAALTRYVLDVGLGCVDEQDQRPRRSRGQRTRIWVDASGGRVRRVLDKLTAAGERLSRRRRVEH